MSILSSRRYLSVQQISVMTTLSKRTVYRMADEGRVPGATKIGGRLVFREDAVKQWLDEAERKTA